MKYTQEDANEEQYLEFEMKRSTLKTKIINVLIATVLIMSALLLSGCSITRKEKMKFINGVPQAAAWCASDGCLSQFDPQYRNDAYETDDGKALIMLEIEVAF